MVSESRKLIFLLLASSLFGCTRGFRSESSRADGTVGSSKTNAAAAVNLATTTFSANSGFILHAGQSLTSGNVTLVFQSQGNLVLSGGGRVLWATNWIPWKNIGPDGPTNNGGLSDCTTCIAAFQSDGNLVLSRSGAAYWASGTASNFGALLSISQQAPYLSISDVTGKFLWGPVSSYAGFILMAGQALNFGNLVLVYQTQGNLVLYSNGRALWASHFIPWQNIGASGATENGSLSNCMNCMAVFQADGNLVLYNKGTAYWSSGTSGNPGARFRVSNTVPYLSISDASGSPLFQPSPAPPALVPVYGINWLAPLEPAAGFNGAADFMGLFSDSAAWSQAMSHINGIVLYDYYIEAASNAELSQIFAFVKAHGMLLGISLDAISPPANCAGMYGALDSSGLGSGAQLAAKIRNLGGDLDYILLDEPFYWGHYVGNNGGTTCLFPVDELVANIAPQVRGVQSIFPNVRIGEDEPLVNYPMGNAWYEDYAQWLNYMSSGGMPIVVYHDDALLDQPAWNERIASLQGLLASKGVAYGLIHDGTGALNDSQWMMNFQARVQTYNWAGLEAPAQHAFQTWDTYPSHNLPESSPTSLTGLIDFYFNSPYVNGPAPAALARLTAPNANAWLMTTNLAEMQSSESTGWNGPVVVAYIYPSPASNSGLVPMERLYYPPLNDFLYTCSQTETEYAITLGYVDQGPAGYAFSTNDPRGTFLYNANNNGVHFYTTSESEMAGFLQSHPGAVQEPPRCFTIPYIINGKTW